MSGSRSRSQGLQNHLQENEKINKLMKDAAKKIEEKSWTLLLSICDSMQKEDPKSKHLLKIIKIYRCQGYQEEKKTKEAIDICSEVLATDENHISSLINRGKAFMAQEKYDEASKDFQKVLSIDNSNQEARDSMKSIDRLKKAAGSRDYYKILGVPRSASKSDIKKAFRKLVLQKHPDKFSDPKEKEEATKALKHINDANEVLSSDEKRRIFDSGRDPLSPEEQQQHHQEQQGNPFFGGRPFDFFGGGGSTFTFHF